MPPHIVWFKRDLRVYDHKPLAAAAARGPVLPLYIVEPALWREPDAAARHWTFIRECVDELDQDLVRLGQPLIIRVGDAVQVLDEIRQSHGIAALWSHEETGNGWTFARDRAVGTWSRTHAIAWHEITQFGVQRRLQDRNGWAAAWDRQMAEPLTEPPRVLPRVRGLKAHPLPTTRDLGLGNDGCVERQPGGRRAGLKLLDTFLAGRGRHYRREMSSPLSGATGCSRLSPHLAWGTVSMREAAQLTWAQLRALKGDRSLEARALRASVISFSGRLHWHCHFMQKLESEPSIEFTELHPALRGLRPELPDRALLDAWATGQTGFPFLDACMRSLHATGWLNFRMRAMVMSFASYNLWLPWRATGLHLARQFTDYEPGIHWPQVQMQSGTTGINTIRIYSVVKQGYDQDPNGTFVRRFVPELCDVPDEYLQEPWKWPGADRVIGTSYPNRIVDLKLSTAAAKERIYDARRGDAFRSGANAIVAKHGSRKSGVTGGGPLRGKRGVKPVPKPQLEFDL